MLLEGEVGESRGKMRRDVVLDEGMSSGGWYRGDDTLYPQPYGRVQYCVAPTSDTPSSPCVTTMTTLARGGTLHRTMLSEGVVGGSQGKIRRGGGLD